MKHIFFLFVGLFLTSNLSAQTIYKELNSERLGETRQIKIQLPRNYDT